MRQKAVVIKLLPALEWVPSIISAGVGGIGIRLALALFAAMGLAVQYLLSLGTQLLNQASKRRVFLVSNRGSRLPTGGAIAAQNVDAHRQLIMVCDHFICLLYTSDAADE